MRIMAVVQLIDILFGSEFLKPLKKEKGVYIALVLNALKTINRSGKKNGNLYLKPCLTNMEET